MSTNLPGPIAFIGGGNMARSLVGGLLARGHARASLRVSEPDRPTREAMADDFGIATFDDNASAAEGAAAVVLAVKPQVMRQVCAQIAAPARAGRPLLVSIAAGITTAQVAQWLGDTLPIVRVMPNTPALIGAGAAGLHANAQVDDAGRELAQALLEATGRCVWIDEESLMDAVTAVSGSGPAYVFLLAEAMQAAARELGLPADAARTLVVQTCLGAARMLDESGEEAAELRRRVTSPGGTTQAALETFARGGFERLVHEAVDAAFVRGRELSEAAGR